MSQDILYPLRRLHGWLVQKRVAYAAQTALRCHLRNGTGRKVLIPGTPEHTNLGDSAIVLAQMAFLRKCGIQESDIREVTYSQYFKYGGHIPHWMGKDVFVAQLGGGNMGSQWPMEEKLHRMIVQDFPDADMIIFPQTVYYSEDKETEQNASVAVYNDRPRLVLAAREQKSFEIMQALYPKTRICLIPDIVLSATADTFGACKQNRDGILLCMRADEEQALTDHARKTIVQAVLETGKPYRFTDMHADRPVSKGNRAELVCGKMEELAGAELVITDRLHGMIFAAITGTPCIVFSNYNHKVRGTYEWIRHLSYVRFAESAEDVAGLLPELLAMKDCRYDNTPLLPYFDKLTEVVREYASN